MRERERERERERGMDGSKQSLTFWFNTCDVSVPSAFESFSGYRYSNTPTITITKIQHCRLDH